MERLVVVMSEKNIEDWVWFYHKQGMTVIPVKTKDKRPNIATWADYQHKQPDDKSIEFWLKEGKFENIGVVCGVASNNLVVIDIDDETIVEKLGIDLKKVHEQGNWVVKTGKGYHIYCKSKENPGDTKKYDDLHIEYRANACYVVAPPSIHPSGHQYEFLFDKTPEDMKPIKETDVKLTFDEMVKRLGGSEKKLIWVQDLKKGVSKGARNDSTFRLACEYRNKGLDEEETLAILKVWNTRNNPILPQREIETCVKSAFSKNPMTSGKTATLDDVYKTLEKYLFISDYNRIDVILATALSNQLHGTPIWMFVVGNSGDWKSAFASSLGVLPNCIKIDQITKNTLASGAKDAWDLGSELNNNSKILLFTDMASLTSINTDDKNTIWGQFRNLYDGIILKSTGSGVNKKYENCHVTILACTTQAIRDEILIHSQLGTRELMYDTDPDMVDNILKMDKAWDNEEFEEEMKKDINQVVYDFFINRTVKNIEPDSAMKEFLKEEAQRLSMLRATAIIDRYRRDLINPVYPEIPTRVLKQFKRLYKSLKSLDDNYSDEKIKAIISHIVDSSGNIVRRMVLEALKLSNDWMKITALQKETKLGYGTVKSQLEMLWNLNVISKDVREEQVGGYVTNYQGYEERRGGRTEDVAYYKFNGKTINIATFDDFTGEGNGNV
jgi:hypothetical protein